MFTVLDDFPLHNVILCLQNFSYTLPFIDTETLYFFTLQDICTCYTLCLDFPFLFFFFLYLAYTLNLHLLYCIIVHLYVFPT